MYQPVLHEAVLLSSGVRAASILILHIMPFPYFQSLPSEKVPPTFTASVVIVIERIRYNRRDRWIHPPYHFVENTFIYTYVCISHHANAGSRIIILHNLHSALQDGFVDQRCIYRLNLNEVWKPA